MKRLALHLMLATLLGLSGCAHFNVNKDYSLAGKAGQGLLVLSLTHTTGGVTLDYRAKGDGKTGAFMTGNVQDPMDWENPRGRLVVAELPAGSYELHQWRSGKGNISYTSKPFSIPFVITEGKATYIGNVFININELLGTYKVEVSDAGERDLPLLFQRYRNIRETELIRSVAK